MPKRVGMTTVWSYQMTMHLPDILYFHVNCITYVPLSKQCIKMKDSF